MIVVSFPASMALARVERRCGLHQSRRERLGFGRRGPLIDYLPASSAFALAVMVARTRPAVSRSFGGRSP